MERVAEGLIGICCLVGLWDYFRMKDLVLGHFYWMICSLGIGMFARIVWLKFLGNEEFGSFFVELFSDDGLENCWILVVGFSWIQAFVNAEDKEFYEFKYQYCEKIRLVYSVFCLFKLNKEWVIYITANEVMFIWIQKSVYGQQFLCSKLICICCICDLGLQCLSEEVNLSIYVNIILDNFTMLVIGIIEFIMIYAIHYKIIMMNEVIINTSNELPNIIFEKLTSLLKSETQLYGGNQNFINSCLQQFFLIFSILSSNYFPPNLSNTLILYLSSSYLSFLTSIYNNNFQLKNQLLNTIPILYSLFIFSTISTIV